LAKSLADAFRKTELDIKERYEKAKALEDEYFAINNLTKEKFEKLSDTVKNELRKKFFDWVKTQGLQRLNYPLFKFKEFIESIK